VYNTYGKTVWRGDLKKARDQVVINLSGFGSGIYAVTLAAGNKQILSQKLTITK
jgi:hypothetical protein